MKKILTLLTDFGTKDSYVAEMKGVICSLSPEVRIIDISHQVEQGNLLSASFILEHSCFYFPPGTVHLVVVDPGVGTSRDIITVHTDRYTFIGPDNGVLYQAVEKSKIRQVYALNIKQFIEMLYSWFGKNPVIRQILERGTSSTFHGRDLFAPLAGCILSGVSLDDICSQKKQIVKLQQAFPRVGKGKIMGSIIYIDRFGNLITNIKAEMVDESAEVFIKSGQNITSVGTLKSTYADVDRGNPLSLIGSRGLLEIAVNGGSAGELFGAKQGDRVLVIFRSS